MRSSALRKYLIKIYELERKQGKATISAIAFELNLTKSSASKMVGRLKKDGLVNFPRYGPINLTEKGRQICEQMIRQVKILEDFLKYIGVEEEYIEEEAEQAGILFNPNVIEKMSQLLVKERSNLD